MSEQNRINELKARFNEIKEMPDSQYGHKERAEVQMIVAELRQCANETAGDPIVGKKVVSDMGGSNNFTTVPSDYAFKIEKSGSQSRVSAYQLKAPGEVKNYAALFGSDQKGFVWNDKDSPFFHTVFSGRVHPELDKSVKNAMEEGVPSSGGFWVPEEYSEQIHNVSLENEIVAPRAFVQPMRGDKIHIPAMDIGDHSSNLWGGFTATYTAEAGTMSDNNPKARSMTLEAKKMTGFLRLSRELFDDVPNFEQQVIQICGRGLGWYRDYYFLNGTGAGTPLGILNSPCVIAVDEQDGQAASTIEYQNLVDMEGRMYPAGMTRAVWIASHSAYPQLRNMSVAVGTGGNAIKALERKGDQYYLLERPVFFTEKTPALGSQGDILLADLSQYVVGLRKGLQIDVSKHVYFASDELAARLIERHDGQPLWDEALTLKDGSTTVSPFVALAERS